MKARRKGKFFVIEARRLIPLLFLLVLLLGLTVYENFFRVEQAVTPVQQEEEEGVEFSTTDFGTLSEPTNFTLVGDYDEWARTSQKMGIDLPDYPFNAAEEVAVFSVNSEIQNMEVIPVLEEVEVRVQVDPKENFYHVVTVDRDEVDVEGAVWKFIDEEGSLLSRITPLWEEQKEEEEDEEEDEEIEK